MMCFWFATCTCATLKNGFNCITTEKSESNPLSQVLKRESRVWRSARCGQVPVIILRIATEKKVSSQHAPLWWLVSASTNTSAGLVCRNGSCVLQVTDSVYAQTPQRTCGRRGDSAAGIPADCAAAGISTAVCGGTRNAGNFGALVIILSLFLKSLTLL